MSVSLIESSSRGNGELILRELVSAARRCRKVSRLSGGSVKSSSTEA
jgi:hypothetical protein